MSAQAPAQRLGFGGSVLGGDLPLEHQRALVEAAFDSGFRYFDVAPSYGNGNAERVLGEVLQSVRAEVSIATKVGIRHPVHAGQVSLARRVLRPLKAMAPGLWQRAARSVRRAAAARARFAPAEVNATIEESLRRLSTDRIDVLLLHEARPDDVGPELLELLRAVQREGRVGSFGLGTSVEASLALLHAHPGCFDTVQVDHYWGALTLWPTPVPRRIVTHRCIRNGLELVRHRALLREVREHRVGAELARVLQDAEAAPHLLLRAATLMPATSRTLVSSTQVRRLREFVRAAADSSLDREAIAFNECLSRVAAPGLTYPNILDRT